MISPDRATMAEEGRSSVLFQGRVLVVDDEANARQTLAMLLEEEGFEVLTAADGFKALGVLQQHADCDILLTDLRMPVMDGLELLDKARELRPNLSCVVMTAFGNVESAVAAMKKGAEDFLTKPLNFEAVELVLERLMKRREMARELEQLRQDLDTTRNNTQVIIGNSQSLRETLQLVDQVADSMATVLVSGESGTGKELIARQLHNLSSRADQPFIPVHCAALAEGLLESELFGHEKGAFTGASSQRKGRFEQADGGTLFLDEVGEIPQSTQIKLLRFLQERTFERVGGNKTVTVDLRIVAATNRDLLEMVKEGDFREDLYYRLKVIHITTPPLRSRRSDVPLLAHHFLRKYSKRNHKDIVEIDPLTLERLQRYDWPGNVRELENVLEHAVVVCDGPRLLPRHLPGDFGEDDRILAPDLRIPGASLDELERYAILKTYEATGGNSRETADTLGVSLRKIQYKLKEYREETA